MALPAPATDRTCLVTGASSGIGVEIARQLAAKGLGVTLVARREDLLRELADEITGTSGVRAEVISADLTDFAARTAMLDEIANRGLAIDVLVNNAGFSTVGRVQESDPAAEVRMVQLNVEAVVHLCAAVTPGMVERGAGAVLNVASTASFQPMPGQAGYAASKSFVRSYTEAIAIELAGTGVTASALCPGPVETGFAEAAGFGTDFAEGDGLPSFMWETAADVATTGIEAIQSGRVVAIPGTSNRIMANLATVMPNRLLLPLLSRQHPAMKKR